MPRACSFNRVKVGFSLVVDLVATLTCGARQHFAGRLGQAIFHPDIVSFRIMDFSRIAMGPCMRRG